jgi:integrase/recombinase XerD
MSTRTDPSRRCLPVSEWPDADQGLWHRVTGPVDLLDENRSNGSAWSSPTTHKNRRGYGRWLCFLRHTGTGLDGLPMDRVTNELITSYVKLLRAQGAKPYTQSGRIAELLSVMLAFAPDRDWSWLKRKVNYLVRLAEEAHETSAPPLLAPEIAAKAAAALSRLANHERLRLHEAVAYRNWLMVLLLVVVPLRLKNFTALSIGKDLRKTGDSWEVCVAGRNTKTRRPIRAPVPISVGVNIEFYWGLVRPLLLRGHQSDRLWLNWTGGEMSEHSVYLMLTQFTGKQLGHRINPHAFRHVGATSISIMKPEEIDSARALLGHSSSKTTLQHYVAADSIIASRRHAAIIRQLRRSLPGRSSGRKPTAISRKPEDT